MFIAWYNSCKANSWPKKSDRFKKKLGFFIYKLSAIRYKQIFNTQVIYLKFLIKIDKICDYFGIKIAIYFSWLGFYTRALLIPALLGLAMYLSMGIDEVENFLNIIFEKY